MPKSGIDSFMSKSEPDHFTSRLIVNTGGPIQKNALKTLQASPKPCRVLDRAELDGWDVDWWQYVNDPEEPAVSGPRIPTRRIPTRKMP